MAPDAFTATVAFSNSVFTNAVYSSGVMLLDSAPTVERLAKEMQVVLKDPEVIKRWQDIGAESSTMTPEQYTAFVKTELEKATVAVKASGAKPSD